MRRPALQPSRRAVLGGALAALVAPAVAGCTSADDREAPRRERDLVAADRAAALERRLLAAYDAALVLAPQLADRLQPLRDDHAAHLAALGVPEGGAEAAPTEAAPTEGAPTEPEPTPAPVPAPSLPQDPAALLAALAELERRAAATHGGAAVRSGRGIGAVLASLSASEASHVVALQ